MTPETRSRRAFTLIELMVAMAASSLLMVSILGITGSISSSFTRSEGSLRATSEGRVAFEYLSSDLESALFRGGAGEWMRFTPETITSSSGSIPITATRSGWLTFTAATPERPSGGGDVCAVSYRLAYQDPLVGTSSVGGGAAAGPSYPLFALYRDVAGPLETWAGTDLDAAQAANPSAIAANDMQTDFWTGRMDSAGNPADGLQAKDLLATSILDFSISIWHRQKVPASGTTPATTTYLRSTPTGFRIGDDRVEDAAGNPICDYDDLDHLEVTLTILSSQGRKLVGKMAPSDLIQKHGLTFVQRIEPHFSGALVR